MNIPPPETNKPNNTLASMMPNKNATPTTRAESPIKTPYSPVNIPKNQGKEMNKLYDFFEKNRKAPPPPTNLLVMNPQKKNFGLTGLFKSRKNSRKNRTNKSRKNRKNRKGNTRRS